MSPGTPFSPPLIVLTNFAEMYERAARTAAGRLLGLLFGPLLGPLVAWLLGPLLSACGGGPRLSTGVAPAEASGGAATPALPPIPHVSGPLAITVVYPKAGTLVASRDSNFILGAVGTGDAQLTINGYPVRVEPNGAFLAWLPVPDSATSAYNLIAVSGTDTMRATQPVQLLPPPGHPVIDTTRDTVPRAFPDSGRYVTLDAADSSVDDTDRVVIGRTIPGGAYKWFLFPGTQVELTGRSPGYSGYSGYSGYPGYPGYNRVRLDSALDAWISAGDAKITPLPAWVRPPRRVVGPVRVVPAAGWVDVTLAMGERPPFAVEERGTDLVLTLYGTQATTDVVHYLPDEKAPLVRTVTWTQDASDRARYTVHLARPPFGYLAMWTGSGFVLRVRRPPVVDPGSPLDGRTIVIDPGHPPKGATGPTGLYEPVPTLAVGQALRAILVQRGARVVMTRTTPDSVALGLRPIMARRANAEALVSIHLNALPDGTNPFTSHGTGTYFFQPHSAPLARAVQAGMVRRMGLRDLGVFYDNLALVRATWMPAVLCEGAFIIIPAQEAALRTPEYQKAYAQGVADGLEAYFRSLAATDASQ
jgi:N-acetylmuramoyl-L-alanine amidase